MKRLYRALLLALGLAAFLGTPPVSLADQIPVEKSNSGTWSVEFDNQHFRVVSTATVKVRFEQVAPNQIRLRIYSETGAQGKVSVYWVEFQKYLYNGPIPSSMEPWEGTLNTEGGFVDR